MPDPKQSRGRYQDLIEQPEYEHAEIIDGERFTRPRLAPPAARVCSVLGGILVPPFDLGLGGPGDWIVLDRPELRLAEDIVVPDLAGWRRQRMSCLPVEPFFTLAPDWVCEVLSPATEYVDRIYKLGVYARAAVRHAWYVTPQWCSLEEFQLLDGVWLRNACHLDDMVKRVPPFDAIELDLSLLWRDIASGTVESQPYEEPAVYEQ